MNEVPLGIEWPDGKERFARLKEAVALIRKLWAEERVDFEGTYYRTDNATIYDKPEIPVPIYIARLRSGRDPARRAGRRRVHHHQRQGHRRSTPTRCCRPFARARRRPAARSTTWTC